MRTYSDAKKRLLAFTGTSQWWRTVITNASAETVVALDEAVGNGTALKERIIIAAVHRGHNYQSSKLGKNGRLRPGATRYIHHVIATSDVLVRAGTHPDDDTEAIRNYLNPALRSFDILKRSYGSKSGPLSKEDARKACALTLSHCMRVPLNPEGLKYFSDNYDDLSKYIELFVQRKDLNIETATMLLASKPEQALADGAL